MKGIILAGGSGTRLYPITDVASKQLMPVYDKPLVYYPLSTLMLADIKQILIISTPRDLPQFISLFGDGSQIGLEISYQEQPRPEGIAQAFIIGKKFIGDDSVCLILGDNIFYGEAFMQRLSIRKDLKDGAVVFGYWVKDPQRYGVVEFDKKRNVIGIEEKPARPKSHYAVVGLYFYDNDIIKIAQGLKPSKRGELEITDVNKTYLSRKKLQVELMGQGDAWLDTGTHDSLMDAANFIATVERRQGLKIGCIEEIALKKGFISESQFKKLIDRMPENSYQDYLKLVLKGYNQFGW
ncbi:MAG: glucose-1-phosphate thymidylyltransferase RfbA [Spirochaetes bacterium]|nr:glucose-1-phosphate thymidylyltransferase RfbA [Spirochaetota bacterium]